MLCGCSEEEQRVSIYLSEENEIITASYEEYIAGCVFALIHPKSADAALRAVASAAAGRAEQRLSATGKRESLGADFSDTEPFMMLSEAKRLYGSSYSVYIKRVMAAAEYGASHPLCINGAPLNAELCILSAGTTESGADCHYDENHEDYLSTAVYSAECVSGTLGRLTGLPHVPWRPAEWFQNAVYTDAGTLTSVNFCGARVSGEQLMEAFSLRSTAITIEYTEEQIMFICKGIGRNRGMSTNTAAVLAQNGCNTEEILRYFYGDEVDKL